MPCSQIAVQFQHLRADEIALQFRYLRADEIAVHDFLQIYS